MASANKNYIVLLLVLFVLCICVPGNGVYAFGAGNIPGFAYMEGRAFRHGDIEDVLAELAKNAGGAMFGLGALVGKGSKFSGLDVKRVYFGNWLRDYSQAVDIAGLKKLPLQTIVNLCMVLGFMAHGYATHEFEVTPERLGVYLPTEHIDNPKGYGEGEDPRKYHPALRPPVDPRELEIDPRTGMKNYIANENGSWDTSKALVRRTLERCIELGRRHRSNGDKHDEYEAYRLLGQSLHTLEDFTAHSNFCELALVSMGHQEVFLHVGDHVRVNAPNGKRVTPLVTGTFGSSDFIHSLLGEATDHISQASVSDLNKELERARAKSMSSNTRSGPLGGGGRSSNPADVLRDLLFQLPTGGGEMTREMDSIERIRAGPAGGMKDPSQMSPQEIHAVLWQVLTFRDSVMKKIEKTIEKIPGLGPLLEKLTDSISVFVFTTLEPFLKPLMKTATTGLTAASGEVINNHDQYEVFDNPQASDPTHSFLSKDHFNLILNEPAGKIAKGVVLYAVRAVVRAWDDVKIDSRQVIDDILQCMFHPDFHNPQSAIQREMLQHMRDWVQGLGNRQGEVIRRLSKESVRNHQNIRLKGEGGQSGAVGSAAYNAAVNVQHDIQGYVHGIPGVAQVEGVLHHFQQPGFSREMPNTLNVPGGGPSPGYRPPQGPASPASSHGMPVSPSGEAASYYRSGSGSQQSHVTTPMGPPPGPPPSVHAESRPSPYSSWSSNQQPYNAPSGPGYPPDNSPAPDAHHAAHGYAPSYVSPQSGPISQPPFQPSSPYGPPSGPPPSFPGGGYGGPPPPGPPPGWSSGGAGPSFPNIPGGSGPGSQFPGGPNFPDADPYRNNVPPPQGGESGYNSYYGNPQSRYPPSGPPGW